MNKNTYNRVSGALFGLPLDAVTGLFDVYLFNKGHYAFGTAVGALTLVQVANHLGDIVTGEYNSAFRLMKWYRDSNTEKYRLF